MQIKFSTRQVHGYLAHGSYHVVVDGWKVGTVRRAATGWEFSAPDGHATGRTRLAAVEAYYAARRVEAAHRYGDPCATCGEPADDYNTPKCSTCRRAEERNGTDALSRLYTPGKARLLAEIRADAQSAPKAPQDAAVDTAEPGDTVTAYPWTQSYEALTASQDALLGPSVLSAGIEEARENRRAYDEIARSKAGETCLHCGRTVMFVEETECWFGRDSGYDCPDAPAGFYGIRSHDV